MTKRHDHDPVIDEITTRLAKSGQRLTAGRRALIETLARSASPLTLPELLDAEPDLNQSSAYRNLVSLEELGVVHRLTQGPSEHAAFELTEEFTSHHHHLICTNCGAVMDITISDQAERTIEKALGTAAETHGFEAQHHALDLFGLCGSCR